MDDGIACARYFAVSAPREIYSGRIRFLFFFGALCLCLSTVSFAAGPNPAANRSPFSIHVVDEETNRGVPLVELQTTPGQTYLTDSNGYIAIDDPVLLGQDVFFTVSSHGYEYPKDGFGIRGKALHVKPGGEAILKIKRINVAQRLYRITGAGIYRDSVKLGKNVPIAKPLLNAEVTGQDSVQAVGMGDRIFWFWGDTNRLRYPLGQFNTSGAVSQLPQVGGLDPGQGINLEYFTDASGFSRPMFQQENGVLIWVDGAFSVTGPDDKPRMLAHYSRRKSLEHQLSHGLAVLDEDSNLFKPVVKFQESEKLYPRGLSFSMRENDTDYIGFSTPYAQVRVPATWESAIDPAQYEAFTPLKAGSSTAGPNNLDRTDEGLVSYAWKKDTLPVDASQLQEWVQQDVIKEDENPLRTVDTATGMPIMLHAGSIHWNTFRQRWIMIAGEVGGTSSFLGEVWYAEARNPEGPFAKAVKIVTHDGYSFYNVSHHDFFDGQQGKVIYFEGTYTKAFSKQATRTPWYDYNQIMYRLDLSDPRLKPAWAD